MDGKPRKHEMGEMGKRVVTAIVYVAILLTFFAFKLFVSVPYTRTDGTVGVLRIGNLLFDVLILTFTFIGTWEMTNAFRGKMHASQKTLVLTFSTLVIFTYALSDFIFADILGVHLPDPGFGEQEILNAAGRNYAINVTLIVFMVGVSALAALLVFAHGKVTLESTGYSMLCYCYPSLFLLLLSICNHLEVYSELAILFVFVVAPVTDVFAFAFGKLFGKKLPARMAPSISPKKTIIGGFGGLLGGAVGATILFFVYYGLMRLDDIGATAVVIRNVDINALNLIFYIGLGIVTSAFAQFGDLVESAIKRKVGIKDMGKILPGHGGVLDRIDSSLYAVLIVCFTMVLRIMITG